MILKSSVAPADPVSTRPIAAPRPLTPTGPVAALVPAVARAVRLLDHLAGLHGPQPQAELARALGLPRSSLHGLLRTLVALGVAARNERGEYALGPRPLQWASAFERQSDVVTAFRDLAPLVSALGEETIMLAVLHDADVQYLACRSGTRALAVNFRVGARFPAHCTSTGKAMLATLPAERVRTLLGRGALPRLTRHGVGSVPALMHQLDDCRRRGYAVDEEEMAEGMHCYGAPVFAATREEAVAAVAVSLIRASTTPRRRNEVIAAIRELAALVSERLGVRAGERPGGT